MASASSEEFLEGVPPSSEEFFPTFRQIIESGFTLKFVRDMIITYSQIQRTDKYSQHSSIIWSVWLND